MGKTAEDLRYELELQRQSLSQDLVAIGDRVSPGRIVERRKVAVRQSFGNVRNAVMGAKDSAVGTSRDGFVAAADGIGTATSSAGSTVGSAASSVAETVTGAPHAVASQTQGNPLAAGLIAFGAGALAATLLPKTRVEAQAVAQVQPALESAATELGEQAQSIAETAKEHATEATQHLKETAQDAAESVKAEAQDAAQSVKAEAQGAAAQTKDEAQSAVQATKPT